MLSLKSSLLLNGISSGATGIALILFSEKVATLFGVQSVTPFIATGIFFAVFAALVLYTALQKTANELLLKTISFLDISWVVISIVIVSTTWGSLTIIGSTAALVVAIWVAAMAYLQQKGTSKLLVQDLSLKNQVV